MEIETIDGYGDLLERYDKKIYKILKIFYKASKLEDEELQRLINLLKMYQDLKQNGTGLPCQVIELKDLEPEEDGENYKNAVVKIESINWNNLEIVITRNDFGILKR